MLTFVHCSTLAKLAPLVRHTEGRHALRAMFVGASSLATLPLRLAESALHGRAIERTQVAAPVFVLGHWRSGTTHLHNILTHDPSLGALSMYQASTPGCSLIGDAWLRPLLRSVTPSQRPMDTMDWLVESPQEEEHYP